jgi:hypothetical protein
MVYVHTVSKRVCDGPGIMEWFVEIVIIRWDVDYQHVEVLNIGTIWAVGSRQFNVSD